MLRNNSKQPNIHEIGVLNKKKKEKVIQKYVEKKWLKNLQICLKYTPSYKKANKLPSQKNEEQ